MEPTTAETSAERLLLKRAAGLQRPVSGCLELTPLCNMRCGMCYVRLSREEMAEKGEARTAEDFLALAGQMEKAGVLYLLLTGGEPLLFPGFQTLYLDLKRRGIVLTVNTNGTLIDENWADFFARNKPRRVNITLYGASEETYERLCHTRGGFAKTVNAIRLLRERGVAVKINGSATRLNRQDMGEIYRLGRELDAPVHMDCYMLPGLHERDLPGRLQTRLDPAGAAEAELYALKAELEGDAFPQYVQRMLSQIEGEEKEYPAGISCLAGNCSFMVDWRGQMRPCVSLTEPSAPVFDMGFEAAWQEISRSAKRLLVNEKCVRCRLRPVCKTCAAAAKLESGEYDGLSDYLCRNAEALYRLLKQEAENRSV